MKSVRNFLMHPNEFDKCKHNIDGWFMCEYLSGLMCFWDGGISRGQFLRDIPWAHTPTHTSDASVSTGLWDDKLSPVPVTDKWASQVPCVPIEGIIHKENGEVFLAATGSPSFTEIFKSGFVSKAQTGCTFSLSKILAWIKTRKQEVILDLTSLPLNTAFIDELKFLSYSLTTHGESVYLLKHKQLPDKNAYKALKKELTKYPNGVVLRCPLSVWSADSNETYLTVLRGIK